MLAKAFVTIGCLFIGSFAIAADNPTTVPQYQNDQQYSQQYRSNNQWPYYNDRYCWRRYHDNCYRYDRHYRYDHDWCIWRNDNWQLQYRRTPRKNCPFY